MTKPPLGKVEALLYVLPHVITRGHARILTHPHGGTPDIGQVEMSNKSVNRAVA